MFLNRCWRFQKHFLSKSSRVRIYDNYDFKWNDRKFVVPIIAITGLVCCAEYKKRNWYFPTVAAARPTFEKGNREKFNFIANVVNHVAPAVVYIEIKDLRMKDYVTRFVTLLKKSSDAFSC